MVLAYFLFVTGTISAEFLTLLLLLPDGKARCYFPSLWTDKCKAQSLFSVHGGQKPIKSGIIELFSSHVEA